MPDDNSKLPLCTSTFKAIVGGKLKLVVDPGENHEATKVRFRVPCAVHHDQVCAAQPLRTRC